MFLISQVIFQNFHISCLSSQSKLLSIAIDLLRSLNSYLNSNLVFHLRAIYELLSGKFGAKSVLVCELLAFKVAAQQIDATEPKSSAIEQTSNSDCISTLKTIAKFFLPHRNLLLFRANKLSIWISQATQFADHWDSWTKIWIFFPMS